MTNRVKIAVACYIIAGLALAYVVVTIFLAPSSQEEFENYAQVLQENHGLTFSVDCCPEGASKADEGYTVEFSDNLDKINYNLETITECIKEIPIGLLEEISAAAYLTMVDGEYVYTPDSTKALEGYDSFTQTPKKLHIVLCESVKREKKEIGGYFLKDEEHNYLVLVLGSKVGMRNTFFHEFFHLLDDKSGFMQSVLKLSGFAGWREYNPPEFEYSTDASRYVLGIAENKEDVYFISEYATTTSFEDRADLFEYLMSLEDKSEFDELMQYSNLKKKIEFMSACIMEAYPSVTEDNCFQWQKWLSTYIK